MPRSESVLPNSVQCNTADGTERHLAHSTQHYEAARGELTLYIAVAPLGLCMPGARMRMQMQPKAVDPTQPLDACYLESMCDEWERRVMISADNVLVCTNADAVDVRITSDIKQLPNMKSSAVRQHIVDAK